MNEIIQESSQSSFQSAREYPSEQQIQEWLVCKFAEILEVSPEQIDPHQPIKDYNLDSVNAVGISGDLEDWLGKRLSATVLHNHKTIRELTQFLVSLKDR